jgi:biopolymer transport protein ExbD
MSATAAPGNPSSDDEPDDEPLVPRHRGHHEATFDITAMIDLVFMLNIFFLVTTVAAVSAEMDLPVVRHCLSTDPEDAAIISIVATTPQTVTVYLGDGAYGEGLTDHEEQARSVHQLVEEAARAGKHIILIKAERGVKLRDVKRISAAAIRDITGMELRMAVIEKE